MKVYVMLADGFEEIEALTVIDVLRRGGVETEMVAVKNDKIVVSARNIPVIADVTLDQIQLDRKDIILLPGGSKGVDGLGASESLINLLKEHQVQKGLLAAICAGPTLPGKLGFYEGIKATCYPGHEEDLHGAIISDQDVVVDKNFVTSRGPGTSLSFAYTLLEIIKGPEVSKKIRAAMLYK